MGSIEIFMDCILDIIFVGENGFRYNLPAREGLNHEKYNLKKDWFESFIDGEIPRFYYSTVHMNQYYDTRREGGNRVISVLLPLKYQRTYYGYIQVDMDYEKLYAQLYQFYGQQETDITIINEEGIVLFDKEKEDLDQIIDESIRESCEGTNGYFTICEDGVKRLMVYQKLEETDWYLLAGIPYSNLTSVCDYVLKILWLVILPIFMIISVLGAIAISKKISKPLSKLIKRVECVNIEEYEYQEIDYGVDVLNQLGERFEDSYGKIRELIDKVYIAEIRQKDAQYEVLQNQITPHFMYNSLQLIKTEALLAGNREISGITQSFASLLRYSLEKDVRWVKLEQEKQNIENYLKIYHKRFPEKFTYKIEIQDLIEARLVLKLILQPIVENCMKHGLKDVTKGGRIILRGYLKDDDIWLEVEDNGAGISAMRIEEVKQNLNGQIHTMSNVGLINVHRRILIEDGQGYGLVGIESIPAVRTLIVLRIRGNRSV